MATLKPFWRYYGGKWRAAPRYPAPEHSTIIEPFAGAAGYSLRYADREVILVEKYPVVAEMWRYLIRVSAAEIRRIPTNVKHIDELPAWVPAPARSLIGWWFNAATVSPRVSLSSGRLKLAAMGRNFEGWTEATRERVATQVEQIRHWQCIEGDFTRAPCVPATWFVDPPITTRQVLTTSSTVSITRGSVSGASRGAVRLSSARTKVQHGYPSKRSRHSKPVSTAKVPRK